MKFSHLVGFLYYGIGENDQKTFFGYVDPNNHMREKKSILYFLIRIPIIEPILTIGSIIGIRVRKYKIDFFGGKIIWIALKPSHP